MEPLPGPLDENRDRAPALLAIFWTPFPFTVALICARLFVRLRIKNLGLDDYAMFLAWVFYTISTSLASICMLKGGARHLYYLRPQDIVLVLKYNFMSQPFGAMASAVGKSSVAFLVLRIIGPNTVWRKWFIHSQLVIYLTITIVSIIVTFVQCSPSRTLWEHLPGSTCWNPNISVDITILQSAYGTYMDFVLAIIPITIVRGLKMSTKAKYGLCILLSLGVFAGICSAIKTAHLHSFGARADFTWATYSIFAWSSLEVSLVIICGCIPTVKPIFDHILKGTPVRPFRSAYPNNRSYKVHSNSKDSRKASLFGGRSGLSTQITSTGGSDSRSGGGQIGSAINLRDIRVERGIDIERYDRESVRVSETRGNEVV